MEVVIAEPHFHLIHGGISSLNQFMVVYSYTLCEFYNNEWKEELEFYHRNIVNKLNDFHYTEHDLIRHYRELIKKKKLFQLHLAEIIEDERRNQTCILYTYRLNLFKRIWRKKRQNNSEVYNEI
jgi:hypothetical protein